VRRHLRAAVAAYCRQLRRDGLTPPADLPAFAIHASSGQTRPTVDGSRSVVDSAPMTPLTLDYWAVANVLSVSVHLGEVKLRGPDGVTVEVVAYVDEMQIHRQVYRLQRHGVWIGDDKTVDELGRHVDLSTLVEDTAGGADEPASCENGDGPA
jgi:hypothetical protein